MQPFSANDIEKILCYCCCEISFSAKVVKKKYKFAKGALSTRSMHPLVLNSKVINVPQNHMSKSPTRSHKSLFDRVSLQQAVPPIFILGDFLCSVLLFSLAFPADLVSASKFDFVV